MNATDNNTRRQQTDTAVGRAQAQVNQYVSELTALSQDPDTEQVVQTTCRAVREILFSALEHAPLTPTGVTRADVTLRRATSVAAHEAQQAARTAIECNITAANPHRSIEEHPHEWLHRIAPTLTAAAKALRDIYSSLLLASTESLREDQDTKPARQQAISLSNHVAAVLDTTTNTGAVRERMPSILERMPSIP